jgi:hypothetical protein
LGKYLRVWAGVLAEAGQGDSLQNAKKGGKQSQYGVVGGMELQYTFILANKQAIGASAKINLILI